MYKIVTKDELLNFQFQTILDYFFRQNDYNLTYVLQRSGSSVTSTPCLSRDNSRQGAVHQHSMLVQTSFDSQR